MAHNSSDVIESYTSETGELLNTVRQNMVVLLKNSKNIDTQALTELLRALHTIKGNSRILEFNTIEKLSHSLEDVCKGIKDSKVKVTDRLYKLVILVADKIDTCLKNISRFGRDEGNVTIYLSYCDKIASGELIDVNQMVQDINREENANPTEEGDIETSDGTVSGVQSIRIKLERINEIISSYDGLITREFRLKHQLDNLREIEEQTGSTEISKIRKQLATDIEALETTIFSVQQQIFDLRMLPLSIVLDPLQNAIERDAITLGKEVKCAIVNASVALDKVILEQLNDILTHLIRNALDHGIEAPEARKLAGKPEHGTITISCSQDSNHVELRIEDDGQGIDFQKVRAKAIANYAEKTEEIQKMSEKELSSFLFMSGFSTKEKVSAFSGRGVGLDVVRTNIEKIKGRVRVESKAGKGTTFILTFPLSLATLQGLFVFSGGRKLLIPSQYVVDIVYRNKKQFVSLQNQSYLQLNGELIPLYSLGSLFDRNEETEEKTDNCNIVIAEYMEQKVGIMVDIVQRYVSLAVKPLPACFENFSILQGIVFDEHYAIVPILYLPDIITRFKALRGYDIKKYEAKTRKPIHRILVCDDSATTRQIEKTILEKAGFMVDTASDGIEGLEQMKEKRFDIIISDIEMPRMDGAVFLDNIRRNNTYKKVPVIIVSSLHDEKTISTFKAAGANAIMNKSEFKRDVVISTIKELLNA